MRAEAPTERRPERGPSAKQDDPQVWSTHDGLLPSDAPEGYRGPVIGWRQVSDPRPILRPEQDLAPPDRVVPRGVWTDG